MSDKLVSLDAVITAINEGFLTRAELRRKIMLISPVEQPMSAREYERILHRMEKTQPMPEELYLHGKAVNHYEIDKAISIVEQWAKEHPEKKRKTYKEDFLEKFPEVQMRFDEEQTMSRPVGCRMNIYGIEGPCTGRNCFSCWNEVIED